MKNRGKLLDFLERQPYDCIIIKQNGCDTVNKEDKVRILAVAPYTGLARLFQDAAAQRENMTMCAYEADTVDAVPLVRSLALEDYDIIISRGYTCKIIQRECNRHVLDVGISVYDILRSIRIAQSYQGKFAIVGFHSIVHYAEILRDLLQYELNIVPVQSIEEIDIRLKELKEAGYTMIVGDVVTTMAAQRNDLQSILILTSRDSVDQVLDLALSLYQDQRSFVSERAFFQALISSDEDGLLVYDEAGQLIFSSPVSVFPDTRQLEAFTRKYISAVQENGTLRLVKTVGSVRLHMMGRQLDAEKTGLVVFRVKGVDRGTKDTGLVRYCNREDLEPIRQEVFHTLNPALRAARDAADQFRFFSRPVMVIGAAGSGKDTFARYLYSSHTECRAPIVVIDCVFATQKAWESLLQSDSSPLFDQKCVLYFKGIHKLTENQRVELLRFIRGTALEKRCQLIFSGTDALPLLPAQDPLVSEIVNVFQAQIISIPSLNDRREDIPNLAMLYLSELNGESMSEAVAFDAEALAVLQNYNWIDNLYQLRRVVREICVHARSAMIGKEETIRALKRVECQGGNQTAPAHELDGTLEEITRRAVQAVLIKENMNQTRAAKRLGISRSTLRRYMN